MATWKWVLLGGGVLYYVTQREKMSVKIAANNQATSAVNSIGRGVNTAIDESLSALGRFLGGLGSGSSSSNSSSSSGSAYRPDSYFEGTYDFGDSGIVSPV